MEDNKVYVTTWPGTNDKLLFDFSKFPVIQILSDENTTQASRNIIINFQGAKNDVFEQSSNLIVAQSVDGKISLQSIGIKES